MFHCFRWWLLLASAVTTAASADTEIHRCVQPDGSVAFQETPCPEADPPPPETDEVNNPATDAAEEWVNPYDLPEETPTQVQPSVPLPSTDRAECEKLTRDAIDAIDRDMQQGYTEQEGQDHMARLLELTRQLRACKTL